MAGEDNHSTVNSFECDECGCRYKHKKNLYAHIRNIHGISTACKINSDSKLNIECNLCKCVFSTKLSLLKHTKSVHSSSKTRNCRIKCSECSKPLVSYNKLREHLVNEHDKELNIEKLTLKCNEDFQEWKANYQRKNFVCYVLDTSSKKCKSNTVKYYYRCHRSNSYKGRGSNQRSIKNIGTNKIGAACPSTIEVVVKDGTYCVTLFSTHIGHEAEIGRTPLQANDRAKLAGRLAEGVTLQRVLDDVRDSVSSATVDRMQLLERKDLHNIKRDFHINYVTRKHENDAISVKLWVDSMHALEDKNPVLFYKEQGQEHCLFQLNDFVLIIMTEFQSYQFSKFGGNKICIDGTHGLTNYGFQLYSLLVVDDYGSGVPVAFCFSNRGDTTLFKEFFSSIKEKIGAVSTKAFMSDDFPAFYNAWCEVMGPVPNRLLCSWHIQRNWFQNLNKIAVKSKKSSVFKTLKVLQCETNIEVFTTGLAKTLKQLLEDEETREFGIYFQKTYFSRAEMWAYCHRKYIGINTNMYLESLHKRIKYLYLEGKKCKRLDKSINALLGLVRDKTFESIIRLSKNKLSDKSIKIRESHKSSEHITEAMVIKIDEDKWLVASSSLSCTNYLVEKCTSESTCNYNNCHLKCIPCSICIHSFKCSCINNVIQLNVCKHIHACARLCVQSNTEDVKQHDSKQCTDIIQLLPCENNAINSNTLNDIKAKCDLIVGLSQRANISDKGTKVVFDYLNKVIDELNKGEVNFKNSENVNTKQCIEKQVNFTAKKKNKLTQEIPSVVEAQIIRNSFTVNDNDVLNVHQSFDHTYCK